MSKNPYAKLSNNLNTQVSNKILQQLFNNLCIWGITDIRQIKKTFGHAPCFFK